MFLGVLATMLSLLCVAFAADSEKVPVDLYIETLCPYCSGLMHVGIKQLLDDGILDIADVTIVPSVRFLCSPAAATSFWQCYNQPRLSGSMRWDRAKFACDVIVHMIV